MLPIHEFVAWEGELKCGYNGTVKALYLTVKSHLFMPTTTRTMITKSDASISTERRETAKPTIKSIVQALVIDPFLDLWISSAYLATASINNQSCRREPSTRSWLQNLSSGKRICQGISFGLGIAMAGSFSVFCPREIVVALSFNRSKLLHSSVDKQIIIRLISEFATHSISSTLLVFQVSCPGLFSPLVIIESSSSVTWAFQLVTAPNLT